MKSAVIVFPGSTDDLYEIASEVLPGDVDRIWYKESNLADYDLIMLSGGFSYGDYLRAGALAVRTPIINVLKERADAGQLILGVGNGFQILLEAGLLPGAMLQNKDLDFVCKNSNLIVRNNRTPFTEKYAENEVVSIPIAHGTGRYYCDQQTLEQLKANQQIIFTYQDNPNGSVENIAGMINQSGNVLGMMPHPERATSALLGSEDGLKLFQSIIENWRGNHVTEA
ncbi:MAG TPA: phosphoribosylformylglycinamidine synthase subunit PurQ [Bacilli bacterium]|nr:phosphoribosylformylglycinamidine synthase subunit PurQ [Bacilli bacterium]